MNKPNASEAGGSSGGLAATPTQAGARVSSLPPQGASGAPSGSVIDKRRLQELVKEVDPLEQLDEDVEEILLQVADNFIEAVVTRSCHMAKHRRSNTLEAKDIELCLEKNFGIAVPGYNSEGISTCRKPTSTEAHRQRIALIRKTQKKS